MAEAAQSIAVKDHDGKVVIEFYQPVKCIALDPQNAVAVAVGMTEAAYRADGRLMPANPMATAVIEQKAEVLRKRLEIVLGGALRRKTPKEQAAEVVDIVLSGVL